MYLTSHRVRTANGRVGINAFLHEHGSRLDDLSHALMNVEKNPGKLVAAACEVPPMGNSVLSYLDVIIQDNADERILDQTKKTAWLEISKEPDKMPVRIQSPSSIVQFARNISRHRSGEHLEDYGPLWDKLLSVFRDRPRPPWFGAQPITILLTEVSGAETARRYSVDDCSFSRLQKIHGAKWLRRTLTVELETLFSFEEYHGDINPTVVSALTDLRLDKIVEMGGIRIARKDTPDITIWQWPPTEETSLPEAGSSD